MSEFITREHNLETGEIIDREMTAEEIEMHLTIKAEADAAIVAEAEAQAKRAAALAKLEALGLNEDDLKALGL